MEFQNQTVTQETTTTSLPQLDAKRIEEARKSAARQAAMNGLAVIGFLALIVVGITLAIYAARYVPPAVTRLSTATNSALSNKGAGGQLAVVPSAVPTQTVALTPPAMPSASQGSNVSAPSYGTSQTASAGNGYASTQNYAAPAPAYPTASAQKPALYGLSELATSIVATGYLANGTNDSFVPAQVIPPGARAAVQFTITNVGTNATGLWGFLAQLPNNEYTFTSPVEQNLNPGDHILFTLGFDTQPAPGPQTVVVVADPNNQLQQTTRANDEATAAFEIGQ